MHTDPHLFVDLACPCHDKHNDVANGHSELPASLQHRLHVGRSLRERSTVHPRNSVLSALLSKRCVKSGQSQHPRVVMGYQDPQRHMLHAQDMRLHKHAALGLALRSSQLSSLLSACKDSVCREGARQRHARSMSFCHREAPAGLQASAPQPGIPSSTLPRQ